jgi:hypothetical protein
MMADISFVTHLIVIVSRLHAPPHAAAGVGMM